MGLERKQEILNPRLIVAHVMGLHFGSRGGIQKQHHGLCIDSMETMEIMLSRNTLHLIYGSNITRD